jgi:SAM-dependent methyltransferase
MKNLARRIYRRLRPREEQTPQRFNKLDFRSTYLRVVKELEHAHGQGTDEAMGRAVGGNFAGMGLIELETLKHFGLREDGYVIDVGCGSGRLAKPLSAYSKGKYLGIDVVPALLAHARKVVNRPEWRFEQAAGLTIPEADNAADMVCFFSVLTHLLHEQSFAYLREAVRVLKPEGRIVFSFLDYTVPSHWGVFEDTLTDVEVNAQHLNVFMSKDGIAVWAERLGMALEAIHDGHRPYVPLSKPITFDDGSRMETLGTVGQSICVLQKRAQASA